MNELPPPDRLGAGAIVNLDLDLSVATRPSYLNLFIRRVSGRDFHHVCPVLRKPGIDAHGVGL